MLNINFTLLQPVSLRSQFAIFENSSKKNLHCFRKTFNRKCLTELWICLRTWICQGSKYCSGSKYARVLHILGFLIYQGSQYARVLNMPGFWIYQGSEYTRFLNTLWLHSFLDVPECLWIITGYAWYVWICQNIEHWLDLIAIGLAKVGIFHNWKKCKKEFALFL